MLHARDDYNARIQDSAGLIPDDEPVLLIRGQDVCALAALDAYMEEARLQGVDPDLVAMIDQHRYRVLEWQLNQKAKVPDLP